ncbi:MAG TPA: HAD family hydrolase [Thermoplasmata archaeon]|nr:HAD family hydrolase [Thermoplasmata archaeon]
MVDVRPNGNRPVVLFDMDDTLFDHTFALRGALARVWRDDPPLRRRPFRSVLTTYTRLLDEIHPEVLQHRRTHAEARQERFRRLFDWAGVPRSPAEFEELSVRYRTEYQALRRPVPGALTLLRSLRGRATVGVVSNNHTTEQRDKMAATGLVEFVDFLVTSEDAGSEKPAPAIFRTALQLANRGPDEAVMVGDTWSTDIVGARALGIRAVWLNRAGQARPDSASEVLELRSLVPARRLARRLLAPDW